LKSLTTYYHGMMLGLTNIMLCKWEAILRKRSAAEDIFNLRGIAHFCSPLTARLVG